MKRRDAANDMFLRALAAMEEAERMVRQAYPLSPGRHGAVWEPPIDIAEADGVLYVWAVLPGVDPDMVEVRIEHAELVLAGQRRLPPEFRRARIHRMELPRGRLERRIPLPPGNYRIRSTTRDGCLMLRLEPIATGGDA
ncbi:Hsp20/alpha crystallin family protein [Histidinibacterium aquaticum]|uniref:Hsp20/alpha crystallin family protein n=1 Tax=Histidinibacterium aquaticum TaxID=2613962 RepID=A0A5J5GC18_9RHOB|nr:Hsp20/alpha crystallin family protein [Histidinibacterium aquaticum]KAA9004984.1 Hsp20/alpha crystallin family protein [Histidinibacterium aquaticum]